MDDLIRRQAVQEMIDRIGGMYPYRKIGNRESYSQYNEAWTDAINRVDAELNSLPSAQPEIIRCKDCKHWTQSVGKMKSYGLGRCDFHDADLVVYNGFCYWAERRTDEID